MPSYFCSGIALYLPFNKGLKVKFDREHLVRACTERPETDVEVRLADGPHRSRDCTMLVSW